MSSRPNIHIQASFLTLHCDIFLFDIISSLFPASDITTCDIRSLSFLSSLLTWLYPYFTLSGGFSHISGMEDCHILSPVHPMGNGSKILFWEVVLLVRIHVTFVCGEGLIICVCIFMWGHSLLIRESAKKKKIAHCSFSYSPLGMCMDVLVCFIKFMC